MLLKYVYRCELYVYYEYLNKCFNDESGFSNGLGFDVSPFFSQFPLFEINDYYLNVISVHRRHYKFHRNVDEIRLLPPNTAASSDTFQLGHCRELACDNLQRKMLFVKIINI